MPLDLIPVLSFVLISTFTPGPSNIASASMGVLHGYKQTVSYQVGLAGGVFLVMLVGGWLSSALLQIVPAFEPALRYIGAGYMLYLAFGILKASYMFADRDTKPLGFTQGVMLQVLNPKLFFYAFTLFSAFLASITGNLALLAATAAVLAAVSFGATTTWALFGAAIKTSLHQPRVKAVVNCLLALVLVYAAFNLVGVL